MAAAVPLRKLASVSIRLLSISAPRDRITVALIPQASDDLQRLQDRTGLSKTDIANRAIILYEFIDSQLKAGRDLIVKDHETGESQLVKLL